MRANFSQTSRSFAESKAKIDRAAGVIHGVSVITEGKAIGHNLNIDAQGVASVVDTAQAYPGGVRVKMDHGSGFDAIVGTLRNFRIDGKQARADLHLLKSHPRYVSILDIAGTMPESCGLSISFSGDAVTRDGEQFMRCLELYSVDLVDRPAANPGGLFSANTPPTMPVANLEKLARHTFGDNHVDSLRGADFESKLLRNFHFNNLSVPGLDLRATAKQFGAPKAPFGLARISQSALQQKVNEYFTVSTK